MKKKKEQKELLIRSIPSIICIYIFICIFFLFIYISLFNEIFFGRNSKMKTENLFQHIKLKFNLAIFQNKSVS